MSQTHWECEKCDAEGIIDTPKGTDFFTAVAAIAVAHRAKSPHCEWDSWKIKVSLVDEKSEAKK